jgi:protein-tyrosine phosphatase
MLRNVILPFSIQGCLYLSSMPGRFEPFEKYREAIFRFSVRRIISLVPQKEIEYKSAAYAAALKSGELPCEVTFFPIPDCDIPLNSEAFIRLVRLTADRLREKENILVHCAAGMGRTGIFAISVLTALGLEVQPSIELVRTAGSFPESPEQWDFIRRMAVELAPGQGTS